MKELETHFKLNNQERVELNVKKQQKIEKVLQGTIMPQNGHFIWEINKETGEIKKAEFKKVTAVFGAEIPPEELVIKPECVYIPALNAKNAEKKYKKNKDQSAYFMKPSVLNLSDINFLK
jgi:hypothetical protein